MNIEEEENTLIFDLAIFEDFWPYKKKPEEVLGYGRMDVPWGGGQPPLAALAPPQPPINHNQAEAAPAAPGPAAGPAQPQQGQLPAPGPGLNHNNNNQAVAVVAVANPVPQPPQVNVVAAAQPAVPGPANNQAHAVQG